MCKTEFNITIIVEKCDIKWGQTVGAAAYHLNLPTSWFILILKLLVATVVLFMTIRSA